MADEEPFELPLHDAPEPQGPALVVDVDGYEGPLDLLLTLARSQKVDLTRISILALAEQYLTFVHEARKLRLELAADYLVMAAWLAYLKSRLLLPEQKDDDEPTGEELAAALAFRLRRLEAMREVAARLMNRNRLGRDVFPRGAPETVAVVRRSEWGATIYDLLMAYASQRQRNSVTSVSVGKRSVWSLADARTILTRLVGAAADWAPIDSYLATYMARPEERVSVLASAFSASLELVREGKVELRQSNPFAPLYIRWRPGATANETAAPQADEAAQEEGGRAPFTEEDDER
ncbi:condensin subunit ScpA [Breoghania corrubedonensis]|uniref:Segregation and condensation protein A n=1 Tax=Breoghania corrubedonensis TaxID=665038 RepID=A0A2T5V8E8_9HYPH|nr:ScpA family protein [Breoghania corrubedonensis]PTW60039.1 condensin subunit ScpA [Breoghania corrubedonensis]